MSFFIIDGSALIFRAYFAFIKNPLKNSSGQNVSALYGFANSIIKLCREHNPQKILIALDRKEPTFRHVKYPLYKANREKMPDDLAYQIPWIHDFIDKLNVTHISIPGFEADDIIGTLCKEAGKNKIDSFIVTGDKDFFQLIDEHVSIFNIKAIANPNEQVILDKKFVRDKYGIDYSQVIDYLALIGDASDNIPGVSGVGPKSAEKLLNKFSSIDEIYKNLDKVNPVSLRKKLETDKNSAYLSYDLLTIKTDVDFKIDFNKYSLPDFDNPGLVKWLEEKELHSLKKYFQPKDDNSKSASRGELHKQTAGRIIEEDSAKEKTEELLFNEDNKQIKDYENINVELFDTTKVRHTEQIKIIETIDDFKSFETEVSKDTHIVIICENIQGAEHLFFYAKNNAWIIRFALLEEVAGIHGEFNKFISKIYPKFIGYEVKYIIKKFIGLGLDIKNAFFDIKLCGFLLDADNRNPTLENLSGKYLIEDAINAKLISTGSNEISVETLLTRAACYIKLHEKFLHLINKQELKDLFYKIEIPMIYVLALMECNGIKIDAEFLNSLKKDAENEITELTKIIHNFAGENFNINSSQQLGTVLFEKLEINKDEGIKKVKKTKTGYSTASETLLKYSRLPIVKMILRYRLINKLKTTYMDSLTTLIDAKTHRLHATFNQMVTVTGRLSSTNPNLQNIPVRTTEGAMIRKAFVADKGNILLSADYSQIELRILAHLSGDPVMIEAFESKKDIHQETAARVFNLPLKEVTQEHRSKAKAVNFGVVYGMGAFKLSQDTGMTIKEAQMFIENYFNVYKGVRMYIEHEIEKVKRTQMTRNLFGRMRALPDINSERGDKRVLAEHMAVNTPIQGTAADLIKNAMIRIQNKINELKLHTRMVLQIHDELLFEVPEKELEQVKKMVKWEMENAMLLRVPLSVTIGAGKNWLDAH